MESKRKHNDGLLPPRESERRSSGSSPNRNRFSWERPAIVLMKRFAVTRAGRRTAFSTKSESPNTPTRVYGFGSIFVGAGLGGSRGGVCFFCFVLFFFFCFFFVVVYSGNGGRDRHRNFCRLRVRFLLDRFYGG